MFLCLHAYFCVYDFLCVCVFLIVLSPKRKGGDFDMEIPNILNASSTRFIGNFRVVERMLQHILFLNLNPSSQTNFVILVLWTSKD